MEKLEFFKMQAAGNDYIYIDCFDKKIENPAEISQKLSKRRFSVGSDGLVLIEKSDMYDCKMIIYNSDGSEGEMCGNALRCVGKYMSEKLNKKNLKVQTKNKICKIKVLDKEISVDMSKVEFLNENLPVASKIIKDYKGKKYTFYPAWVGNPHAVCFVENFDFDIVGLYKEISESGIFKKGVNVEYVNVNNGEIFVRVIERGSGETFSCGSGACAAAAVIARVEGCFKNYTLNFKGGILKVDVDREFNATLSGEAHFVYKGVIEI